MTKPRKSILQRDFKYTPAAATSVRKTWDRLVPGWNKPKAPAPKPAVVRSIKKAGNGVDR